MNKSSILISSFNGEKYIRKLLFSIINQTNKNIEIIIRDDGSTDNTLEIVNHIRKTSSVPIILLSDNVKNKDGISIEDRISYSFFSLLKFAISLERFDYFFFCDQDDIWVNSKVEKFLLSLNNYNNNMPLLIHSDLSLINSTDQLVSVSMWQWQGLDPTRNSVSQLLFQNTVTGCASMINLKLASIITAFPPGTFHDHFLAVLASSVGRIIILNEQLTLYRQHTNNTAGAGISISNIYRRLFAVMSIKKFFVRVSNVRRINYVSTSLSNTILKYYYINLSPSVINIFLNAILAAKSNILFRILILLRGSYLPQSLLRSFFIIFFRN